MTKTAIATKCADIELRIQLKTGDIQDPYMKIIFHYPLPLNPNASSASGIRPLNMLAAFESLGYEVDVVTGYSKERKKAIRTVKDKVKTGTRYEFIYSESSTMPTILTDSHHLPLNPFLDFSFFRFCKVNAIPIGLFYRDIYWLFDSYGKELSWIEKTVAKICFRYDLLNYKKYVDILYLPSLRMGRYVPVVPSTRFLALPPGLDVEKQFDTKVYERERNRPLRVFYVGGMSDHYQMTKLFRVIARRTDVELIVCTRKAEWQAVEAEYPVLTKNIQVVHEIGKKMEAMMISADLFSLFVKPQEYWEFAAPVKLYEYLGYAKPIIASKGTLAGDFVEENAIGWSVEYSEQELESLFNTLRHSPEMLTEVRRQMMAIAPLHTWQLRAKQVIKDLIK